MPETVVERVADSLEIQPEQTDRVLRTLAELIKKQSARDGRVNVPGLGVFQQAADALAFEPDATLAAAVNHRYAGLETVQLSTASEADTEAAVAEVELASADAEIAEAETASAEAEEEVTEAADEVAEAEMNLAEAEDEQTEAEEELVEDEDELVEDEEELAEDEDELVEAALEEEAMEDVVEGTMEAAAEEVDELFFEEEPAEKETFFFEDEPVAEEEDAVEDEEEATFFEDEYDAHLEAPTEEEGSFIEETEDLEAEETEESEPFAFFTASQDEDDFDDPDISEKAAYEQLLEGMDGTETEDDLAPGTTFSQADLDTLLAEKAVPETDEEEPSLSETDTPTDEVEVEVEDEVEEVVEDDVEESIEKDPEASVFAVAEHGQDQPAQPIHEPEPQRRSMWPWFLVIGAFIIVAGAIVLYQTGLVGSSADPDPITVTTPPSETPQPATDPTTTPAETPASTGDTETPTETPVEETPAETLPEETSTVTPPSASGQDIDRSAGGYTLVVASLPQSAAEAEVERLRQRYSDVPVDVISGESGGQIRYRVAIGQEPTIEALNALRSRLGLSEDAWVLRVTPDG